ncbi:hypothetical protein MEO93_20530 [Dolichospermum sp. ST_sed3]|nr:hypothetical protein [Dolichospermum sp. ST_sed9]MDD1442701.1 hypothetical protein [Dolichospermum sp. ST_sed3]
MSASCLAITTIASSCIIRGPDARTTRNFGIFFKLEVSNLLTVSVTIEPSAETPEPTGETVMMGGKLL